MYIEICKYTGWIPPDICKYKDKNRTDVCIIYLKAFLLDWNVYLCVLKLCVIVKVNG